jgi:hypothetical protein
MAAIVSARRMSGGVESSRLSQTVDLFGKIGDHMKLADDENAAVAQVLTD